MKKVYIINFKGEKEPFSFKKVYQSAKRAGASNNLAKEIARRIQSEVYPGMKTSEIFNKIQTILSKKSFPVSIKFSLKDAIRRLGPTGFPFEKYIGEVLQKNGFQAKLNQYIYGICGIRYEIDFIAQRGDLLYVGECKYRNQPSALIHSGDVVETYGRFLDLKDGEFFQKRKYQKLRIMSIVVTNAKFTDASMKYAKCRQVELLGWRYPKKGGLEYLIESQGLYPITILPSFKNHLFECFNYHRMMLAQDILKTSPQKLAEKIDVSLKEINPLVEEAKILLGL